MASLAALSHVCLTIGAIGAGPLSELSEPLSELIGTIGAIGRCASVLTQDPLSDTIGGLSEDYRTLSYRSYRSYRSTIGAIGVLSDAIGVYYRNYRTRAQEKNATRSRGAFGDAR